MNKRKLIDDVAASCGLVKKDVKPVIDATISIIKKRLLEGDKVTLVGFGKFFLRLRPEHTGRNPRTGEIITVKAQKGLKFEASREFKKKIKALPID